MEKAIYLMREDRFVQRDEPLLKVRNRKVLLWIVCQLIGVAAYVAISETIAAISITFLLFSFTNASNSFFISQVSLC